MAKASSQTTLYNASGTLTKVEVLYALGTSETTAPTSGWSTTAPAWQSGKYMWQKTVTTYGDAITESEPTCITGATGQAGEDATTLRIDSSRGTVFKNSEVSTVLSAVIYKGGKRITDIDALHAEFGSSAYLEWKWQRLGEETFGTILSNDSRIGAGGFTFTLSPDDVDTKVVFMCQLVTD